MHLITAGARWWWGKGMESSKHFVSMDGLAGWIITLYQGLSVTWWLCEMMLRRNDSQHGKTCTMFH